MSIVHYDAATPPACGFTWRNAECDAPAWLFPCWRRLQPFRKPNPGGAPKFWPPPPPKKNHERPIAYPLLMMPPRAKDGGEWMKRSQELIDTASVALRAAESRNVDELHRIGGVIDEACENCHKKYWPNY